MYKVEEDAKSGGPSLIPCDLYEDGLYDQLPETRSKDEINGI